GTYRAPLGDTLNAHTYTADQARTVWYSGNNTNVLTGQTWLNGGPATAATPYPAASGPLAVLSNVATGPVPVGILGAMNNGANFQWLGDIAEVIVYDHALTGPERHQVEESLIRKYQTVTALPPTAPVATPNGGKFTGSASVSLTTI